MSKFTRTVRIRIITLLVLLTVVLCGCTTRVKETERKDQIIGVKIYEYQGDFTELFGKWKELGVNTVFTSVELYSNADFRKFTRQNNLTTFIIVPVFYDPDALGINPGLYALTERGTPARDDWVSFVCPSREDFRKQKIDSIKNLVRTLNPDGISIDFIRHFVFWEKVYPETPPDSLLNTCFDTSCVAGFQEKTGIMIPDSMLETGEIAGWLESNYLPEWTQWKCELITGMIHDITTEVRKLKPDIYINAHIVPWRQDDFNGAIRSIAGQDLGDIAGYVDYLSPMTYAHMVKQTPQWIHSVVREIYQKTGSEVIPSIQVSKAYLEEELTSAEFRESLLSALKPPSRGVIFWSWATLDQSPQKKEIAKDILTKE